MERLTKQEAKELKLLYYRLERFANDAKQMACILDDDAHDVNISFLKEALTSASRTLELASTKISDARYEVQGVVAQDALAAEKEKGNKDE